MTWQSESPLQRGAFCCGAPSRPQLPGWETESSQEKSYLQAGQEMETHTALQPRLLLSDHAWHAMA